MTRFLEQAFFLNVLKVLILGSGFLAAFLLLYNLMPDEKAAVARKRLGVERNGEASPDHDLPLVSTLYTAFVPIFYSSLLPQSLLRYFDVQRPLIHRRLITANVREEITPDEFLGFKFVMAFVFFLIVLYIFGSMGRPIPWPLLAADLGGGFFAPDFWLAETIKTRKKEIIRAMPYTLDLLTLLSVEAGLDFMAAIQRLTQRSRPNALLIEFGHMLKEIRLGSARADALRNLADRLQIEDVSSFTTLLIQADQLGASVGQVLRAQSDQLRAKRFQSAEAAGARASQLVLFPLVLFIFPAIFIVVLGPTFLSYLPEAFSPK